MESLFSSIPKSVIVKKIVSLFSFSLSGGKMYKNGRKEEDMGREDGQRRKMAIIS